MWDHAIEGEKALLAYLCMITQIYLATGVLELPGIDEMIEAKRTFDFDIIRDVDNPLARPSRQATNILVGLFPQDGQTDTIATIEATEAEAQIKGFYTDIVGTCSALPPVQSVPPWP